MKWSDIDLDAATVAVARQRVHSEAGAVVADTKTDAARRVLPIPATLPPVLKRARRRAAAEKLAVGNKWCGEDYVVADELGRAYYPTTYSWSGRRSSSQCSADAAREFGYTRPGARFAWSPHGPAGGAATAISLPNTPGRPRPARALSNGAPDAVAAARISAHTAATDEAVG